MIKAQPVYTAIGERVRAGIRQRRFRPGMLLLEAPLAQLFGSSRSPVKQALEDLKQEGLLVRFKGRGYLVGPAGVGVRREKLTPAMFGIDGNGAESLRQPTWKTIYDRVERELIHRSIFGQFRINELELSRHYNIGRTVAHDVLTQIQSTGIIARRDRAQWLTVPLDHKRINDLFDLRVMLEPRLCAAAVGRVPATEITAMRTRIAQGANRYPNVNSAAMDELEHDLHVRLLEYGNNVEFFEALRRTRCILISGKHILGRDVPYPPPVNFFFEEHVRVLEALRRGDGTRAARALKNHLEESRPRVIERLAAFRARHRVKAISFISAG